jgi:DNA adenine methylase
MNYMGGKHRQGSKIAETIRPHLYTGCNYFEPFCGALGAAYRVAEVLPPGVTMYLSDVNQALITMWQAVLDGWVPPDVVTESTCQRVKSIKDPSDPMTAYCGYGMSFGSKWFGGYARNGIGTNYALNAQRSTLLKAKVLLKAQNYRDVKGNGIYYLDPPYFGRTKAHGVEFNHDEFWEYARSLVARGNKVFVTEFVAPDDFVPVHKFGDTVVRHYSSKGADGTCEAIFMHRNQI